MTADLDDLRSAFAELTALHGWAPLQTPRSLTPRPDRPGRRGGVAACSGSRRAGRSDAVTPELRDELADCLVYLVALSDALGVDVVDDAVTRIRGAVEASTP